MSVLFITHPEVTIDPALPVPRWSLSDRGVARMRAFARSGIVDGVTQVWSSAETKALEAAEILAAHHALPVQIEPELHENDRSATGFLPPPEFEATADLFFANPNRSIRGWEPAARAQQRVKDAVDDILARSPNRGDIAIIAHGGVGTLLLCAHLGVAISRAHDQPSQGHYWRFDATTRAVLHGWQPL